MPRLQAMRDTVGDDAIGRSIRRRLARLLAFFRPGWDDPDAWPDPDLETVPSTGWTAYTHVDDIGTGTGTVARILRDL
jgi:hypothetical protein